MKTYTVLLLRPDYFADEFGKDTYLAHVEADCLEDAEDRARAEVSDLDGPADDLNDPADYAILLVIEGKHMDIKTS